MTRALSPRTFPPGGWASLLSRKGGGVRVPGGSSCERRGRVLVRDASIAVSWSGSALTGVYPPSSLSLVEGHPRFSEPGFPVYPLFHARPILGRQPTRELYSGNGEENGLVVRASQTQAVFADDSVA